MHCLIKAGADLEARDMDGNTPLLMAIRMGNFYPAYAADTVRVLCEVHRAPVPVGRDPAKDVVAL